MFPLRTMEVAPEGEPSELITILLVDCALISGTLPATMDIRKARLIVITAQCLFMPSSSHLFLNALNDINAFVKVS